MLLGIAWKFSPMANKMEEVSVSLPEEVRQQVDELARQTNRSRSTIIGEAVSSYMRDQSEYIYSLDEIVAGLDTEPAHSGDQIFAWLESWGNETELPSPKPEIFPASGSSKFGA